MVDIESALVSNESLGFLCFQCGLFRHMKHLDSSIPSRMDYYASAINSDGRGLWGTDPPKCIADILEAVLGAIHVHQGFDHSHKAALRMLRPILSLICKHDGSHDGLIIRHPKTTLQQLTGNLVSVSIDTENAHATAHGESVWNGSRWGVASRGGLQSIATVNCGGIRVVSIIGRSCNVATNHASALIVAALETRQDLLLRLQAFRGTG